MLWILFLFTASFTLARNPSAPVRRSGDVLSADPSIAAFISVVLGFALAYGFAQLYRGTRIRFVVSVLTLFAGPAAIAESYVQLTKPTHCLVCLPVWQSRPEAVLLWFAGTALLLLSIRFLDEGSVATWRTVQCALSWGCRWSLIDKLASAMNRRQFLQTLGAGALTLPLHKLAAQQRGKVKITDVKVMIIRGTWDWNLVKIETDSGLYGIGEAYWGFGVKDMILNQFKPLVVGEDPLNVDKLYHKMLMRSAGQGAVGGITVTAASGVEIALWDLAGRILQTPACNLLGGRFRDRVRFYRTLQTPDNVEDQGHWRAQCQGMMAEKFGWTAFKVQGDGIPPKADPDYKEPGHDPYTRGLTNRDLRRIEKAMATVRNTVGPDMDFGVEAHWKYDVRDAINMCKAIEGVKPMWLEDPVPPGNPEAMAAVTRASNVPICTGENLYTREGFRRMIELNGCDIVHIDIPKSGGLLESKRIHDLADNYYISTAAHNPASPVGTIASAHAAASMRDFRVHELAKYIDWWQDLVVHDGPIIEKGYHVIRDKPGFGVEINPDVAKAHLAPGEKWWG